MQNIRTPSDEKAGMRRPVVAALACALAALLAAPVGLGQRRSPRARRGARVSAPTARAQTLRVQLPSTLARRKDVLRGERGELLESPQDRTEWFLLQRTYPSGLLPVAARSAAFRSVRSRMLALGLGPNRAVNGWRSAGPSPTVSSNSGVWGPTSGRVNAVAVSPSDPRLILIGSATGGIWRSTDGGESFQPVSDDNVDLAVGSIAFSKSNPSVAYAAMGDSVGGYMGTGVLKTTDAGRTWRPVVGEGLPRTGQTPKVEVDPSNPDLVYLAHYVELSGGVRYASGFFVSEDGGVSWRKSLAGLPRDFALDPSAPGTIYLAMLRVDTPAGAQPPGIYRSLDRGRSWSPFYQAPYPSEETADIRVALGPRDGNVYVYSGGTLNGRDEIRLAASNDGGRTWAARCVTTRDGPNMSTFRTSTDGGATWGGDIAKSIDMAQFAYNTYLVAHPTEPNTLYVGSRDIYKSTDGGVTWSNLTNNFSWATDRYSYHPQASSTHSDQHFLAFDPRDPHVVYIANDGGLWRADDGLRALRPLNRTLSITQFVSVGVHPTDPSVVFGGTQDNGTQKRAAGNEWREVAGGDGGKVVINPADPSVVFTTYIEGTIYRFGRNAEVYEKQVADAATFGEQPTDTRQRPRIAFYPPVVANGKDKTLYVGTWQLFVSTDLGETWNAPAPDRDLTKGLLLGYRPDVLTALAVSKSDTKVIYTGSAYGRAMRSGDGGQSWDDVTAGLPDRFITCIAVDPNDPRVAYLTVSGFNSGHVFRTPDGGRTWRDISGNLPDIPVNVILIDPRRTGTLYLGTDAGIFRSTAGGNSWTPFGTGMPPVIVTDLGMTNSGALKAATYGRGIYEQATAGVGPGGNAPRNVSTRRRPN